MRFLDLMSVSRPLKKCDFKVEFLWSVSDLYIWTIIISVAENKNEEECPRNLSKVAFRRKDEVGPFNVVFK